jgi:hypothetical protein
LPHAPDRIDEVIDRMQIVGADRATDAEISEHAPAARLRAQPGQPGIGAVHGDAEAQGNVTLQVGGVVRDEVAPRGVRDQ